MERRLGRGLAALFGKIEDSNEQLSNGELLIDIDMIHPNINQPRKNFDPNQLQELADSIALHGVLQPITIRPSNNNTYIIVSGERRWKAAQLAGLIKIPARIVHVDDNEAQALALIENTHRSSLNIIEEAKAIKALIEDCKCSQEDIGIMLCKSRSYISNILCILNLPENIQDMIRRNTLTLGHAKCLVNLKNASELASIIVSEGWNVRRTENYVRTLKRNNNQEYTNEQIENSIEETPITASKNEEADEIAMQIEKALNVSTKLVITKRGGKLILLCKTYEELDKVVKRLTSNE